HSIKSPAPFVIRVKQNDVGLNAKIAKLLNSLLKVLEERRIEAREIPFIRRRSFKRISRRLGAVERIVLGKNTHANLIEGRSFQRRQRLLFKLIALMRPGITRRANRLIRGAV